MFRLRCGSLALGSELLVDPLSRPILVAAVIGRVDALHGLHLFHQRLELLLHPLLELLEALLPLPALLVVPRLATCPEGLLDALMTVLAAKLGAAPLIVDKAYHVHGRVALVAALALVMHDRLRVSELVLDLLPHEEDAKLQDLHEPWVVNAAEGLRLRPQGLLLASRLRLILGLLPVLELLVLSLQYLLPFKLPYRFPQKLGVDFKGLSQLLLLSPFSAS
mmetsp:Transcript_40432/g.96077  ORF Transcript_40432/g.96077 Transcript_40432/m.96077 type:complete len:221 (-) Transcript_40432:378-1040(-)